MRGSSYNIFLSYIRLYMMKSLRLSCLLLLVMMVTRALGQPIVEAKIDSTHLLIGSQARLTLSVKTSSDVPVVFADLKPRELLSAGIEVVRTQDVDTVSAFGGTLELTRDYILTSFEAAEYEFMAPAVMVGRDTLRATDTLRLVVTSVPVDTLHLDQFYGAKDVYAIPFDWQWSLLVEGLLALLCLPLIVWLWRKWRAVKRRVVHRIVQLPPTADQIAQQQIASLRQMVGRDDDVTTIYDQLIATLRQYITARFDVSTEQLTSSQILREMGTHCEAAQLKQLQSVLNASDLVRFANQLTLAQSQQPFEAAAAFVEATKLPPRLKDTEQRDELEPLKNYKRRKHAWLWLALLATTIAIALWYDVARQLLRLL